MNKITLMFMAIMHCSIAWSQNNFQAIIKDEENDQPMVGANVIVEDMYLGASTDITGVVEIYEIPDGAHKIVISFIGYEDLSEIFTFPLDQSTPFEFFLHSDSHEMEQVVVSATRSSRTIADIPTRVEAISGEELDEKANMKPGDIRMLLNESTGIQTQQTSATSYNSSIRIQGLDGKYTQILKDGFPIYGGFSGGLSLLQIVPLDLKQVEVIKGSASTLHGGGAIAGLVNLVSREPASSRQLEFLLNVTSALGLDLSSYYSKKYNKIGTTVFASYNLGTPYDPANIGLTAIPEFNRFTFNPKLFIYFNNKTTLNLGFNTTFEERIGGDIKYIENRVDGIQSYFEENKTTRFNTQLGFNHKISESTKFIIKNSTSYYDRSIEIPDFKFDGTQNSSFSEASFSQVFDRFEWTTGINMWTDQFTQTRVDTSQVVDYNHLILGAFIQNNLEVSEQFSMESGLRIDYNKKHGNVFLPRLALLVKVNPKMAIRFGGGFGYKTPNVFTEETERVHFRNVLPMDNEKTNFEKSVGTNLDVNYRTTISDRMTFSFNSLLFYTRINEPVILEANNAGLYNFQQPEGFIDTKGIETNLKLTYDHFKLFIGYTHADVNQHYDDNTTPFPLVSKHRLNNVLIYEIHNELRIGLEAYYFSPQKLNEGRTSRQYWIFGLMTEKFWEKFSLFLNFENFLDTRQTKFESIYTGSISNPMFRDIYAPVDGFVINGGIKIKL